MIITGSDAAEIKKLRRNLFTDFENEGFGKTKIFLRNKGSTIQQRNLYLPKKVHFGPSGRNRNGGLQTNRYAHAS